MKWRAEDEFRSLTAFWNEAALLSNCMAAETSVSFSRWQQGEQAVAGVGVVLMYHLSSVQTSHFNSITDAW